MSGIPSNTLVRVPGNWVPLSEIEIGDTVISADGSLSKVLAVYDTQRYSKYTKFGDEKGMNYTIQMSLEFSKMFFRTPDKRDLLPKYNPMLKHWALKMVCCTPLPIKYPCKNLLLENRDNRFVTDKFIVMTGHTCL